MKIQHQSGETKGTFFFKKDGEVKAELTYSKAGDTKIIIDHTEVSEELQGEDVGKNLVEHAVNYARENHLKIIPLCPFAKRIMEKDESLQDVLKERL